MSNSIINSWKNLKDVLNTEKAREYHTVQDADAHQERVQMTERGGEVVNVRAAEKVIMVEQDAHFVQCSTTQATLPTSWASANEIIFQLKPNQGYRYIKNLYFRIKVTGATAVLTPINIFFWFTSIEFWLKNGTEKVQTLYPETMLHYFMTYFTDNQRKRMCRQMNFDYMNGQNEIQIDPAGALARSNYTFTMPLLGNFIEQIGGIYFPELKEEIWIKVNTRAAPYKQQTNGTAGHAESGTMSTTSFVLLLQEHALTDEDELNLQRQIQSGTQEYNYIDTQRFTIQDSLWTNSVAVSRQLTSIKGKSPGFLMAVRANPTTYTTTMASVKGTVTKNYLMPDYLGNTASGFAYSIVNAIGDRLTGTNEYYPDILNDLESVKHYPGVWHEVFGNTFIFHSFGDCMAADETAIRKGWWPFTGDELLRITPGTTGAEQGEEWTLQAASLDPEAGVLQVIINGIQAETTIAFDANWETSTVIFQNINRECLSKTIGFDGTPIRLEWVDGSTLAAGSIKVKFTNLPRGFRRGDISFTVVSTTEHTVAADDLQNALITTVRSASGLPQYGAPTYSSATRTLDLWVKVFRHAHLMRDVGGSVWKVIQPEPF